MSLSFTSNGDTTVKLIKVGSPDPIALKYSTDKLDWFDYQIGVEIPLSTNSSLYLSGNNDHFSKNIQNRYQFVTSGEGELTVKGDIRDLSRIEDFAFNSLFSGCANIVDANGLKIIDDANLPSSKARKWTFANMFIDCINLRTPPSSFLNVKPGMWCYSSTFGNCISLTAVPSIATNHYSPYSHYCMFYNCKSLSSAPRLYAFHLADWCYNSMFYGCTSLTSISADFISWTPSTATTNWVTGIETEGQFYNDKVDFIYGVDNVPESWKDYSKMPLTFKSTGDIKIGVNRSTLSYNMNETGWTSYTPNDLIQLQDGDIIAFKGDETGQSFVDAPFFTTGSGTVEVYGNPHSLVNWKTLDYAGNWAFRRLFMNLKKLTDASNLVLSSTTAPKYCYESMFRDCYILTGAPELPATTIGEGCYKDMFNGCLILSSAPELPATTLEPKCYMGLFANTSITSIELPATELKTECYRQMFQWANMLSSIDVNFTEWADDLSATLYWFEPPNGAPWTRYFIKPTALPEVFDTSHIPHTWTGWEVVNK